MVDPNCRRDEPPIVSGDLTQLIGRVSRDSEAGI